MTKRRKDRKNRQNEGRTEGRKDGRKDTLEDRQNDRLKTEERTVVLHALLAVDAICTLAVASGSHSNRSCSTTVHRRTNDWMHPEGLSISPTADILGRKEE